MNLVRIDNRWLNADMVVAIAPDGANTKQTIITLVEHKAFLVGMTVSDVVALLKEDDG